MGDISRWKCETQNVLQPGLGYQLYTRIVAGDMEALAGVWETSPGGSVRVGTERVTARIRPGLGYNLYTRIVAGDMEALAGVWETSPGGSVRVGTKCYSQD
ncbi:hypothetical protein J6590_058403 [Homalodisca vitripennis]|nr:hypothetical protein J6590_058403 [Homalodisca vitripennis]